MTDKEYTDWLASLKVGDKVAVKHRYYQNTSYSIDRIKKITPTRQMDLENYLSRFKNGEVPNRDIWSSTSTTIVPITQEVLDYIERERLRSWLSNVDKTKLSLDRLRQIKAIVEGQKEDVSK